MDNPTRYMAAMKKLAGAGNRHVCQHPGCTRLVLRDFCLEHIEQAIAKEFEENRISGQSATTGE